MMNTFDARRGGQLQLAEVAERSIDTSSVRAAFFDVDGTLLDRNLSLHSDIKAAIKGLKHTGVQVGFATGRPLFAVKQLAEELLIDGPSMFYSGALICRPISGGDRRLFGLEKDVVLSLIDKCKSRGLYTEVFTTDGYYVEKSNVFSDIHEFYLDRAPIESPLKDIAENNQILKVGCMLLRKDLEPILKEFQNFKGVSVTDSVGASHPDIVFINFASSLATRSHALAQLCEVVGCLPSEVMAFGDASADVAFLSESGFGVAMGNAPREVQEKARFVTTDVNDGGVAFAISRFNFNKRG